MTMTGLLHLSGIGARIQIGMMRLSSLFLFLSLLLLTNCASFAVEQPSNGVLTFSITSAKATSDVPEIRLSRLLIADFDVSYFHSGEIVPAEGCWPDLFFKQANAVFGNCAKETS